MTRIYTKTGDKGETSLGDGTRTLKSAARINLYGEVDELNSVIGQAIAVLLRTEVKDTSSGPSIVAAVSEELTHIQSRLFDLGAVLANPGKSKSMAALAPAGQEFQPGRLEKAMDILDQSLAPLRSFILPGGSEASGVLHVARCVSRRAERAAVALAVTDDVPISAIIYLNRLSDFLFTAARSANAAAGIEDVLWVPAPKISDPTPEAGD